MSFRNERRSLKSLPIQLKYATVLTLISSSASLAMMFVMAWFIQRNYSLFMSTDLGISSQVLDIVRREQRLLETSLVILFLVSLILIFGTAFYITRRLTGPIVALERHLLLLARGDWSKEFRLRKQDEFQELSQLVNKLRQAHLDEVKSFSGTPPAKKILA